MRGLNPRLFALVVARADLLGPKWQRESGDVGTRASLRSEELGELLVP